MRDIVAIGASAGGIDALPRLLTQLPASLPATLFIVQHRLATAAPYFVDILQRASPLPVAWAEQGTRHEPGHVYVAPPDVHLLFADHHVRLAATARENHARPSINRMFRSAAAHYGSRTIGVLLTGMLDDGAAGLAAIAEVGGLTFVQDPADAEFPDLPRHGLEAAPTSQVVRLDQLGVALQSAVREPAPTTIVPEALRREAALDHGTARPAELDSFAPRSSIRCIDCGGTLWEVGGPGSTRLRCYLGHAYSARDLLDREDASVEEALWNAVRALHERGSTFETLARDSRRQGRELTAVDFEQRATEAHHQADLARDFMLRLITPRR